jgi:hypothetical protein
MINAEGAAGIPNFSKSQAKVRGTLEMMRETNVYRVLIGSPSGLVEERQAATDAVKEKNGTLYF